MTTRKEPDLRRALGIPDDAEHVIVFAESSHWDPNWLHTSEEYYRRFVSPNLDAAIDALVREPRRVYSIECMFFLRMYWERRPEQQDALRRLVNQGRLRLTSSGVTTADTLLPSTEAILRDLLLGQEWLRGHGMTQEPRLAYFTDSFGCSPALPSLLRAAGFDRTAITRIDGMYFIAADLERARNFPRPGSSAALLLQDEKSLDFVWRDANGAEVLCHWNAFTYGQGDMLAHHGITRAYVAPLAIANRSERHVAHRIATYSRQLAPFARTPYVFCPIGFDFVAPIPDLVALLDRYDRVRYPTTGVWAVNAGLDDYLALVACHREALPVVELDPNPYWTGFYTSRPALKKRCRALVERLLLAEALALLPEHQDGASPLRQELKDAWWDAVTTNHHDFITGTSPDAVVESEQLPWLDRAMETADRAIQRLAPVALAAAESHLPVTAGAEKGSVTAERPQWDRHDGIIRVETPYYVVELSEEAGGSILRAWPTPGQEALLVGVSNDLLSYRDSGGLWRMGHEYRGGYLQPGMRASHRRVQFRIRELDDALELAFDAELDGETIRRWLWFRARSPLIFGRVEGRAARRRTVALQFATAALTDRVVVAQPGGAVARPLQKLYRPTFWPMQVFAHVQQRTDGRGIALFVSGPSAVACHPEGGIELVALRNATRERAFRVLPLLANPASGYERAPCAFDYAILFTGGGDWRENELPRVAGEFLNGPWDAHDQAVLRAVAASVVTVEGCRETPPAVAVSAVKQAFRGEGLIVRLSALEVPNETISVGLRARTITAAFLCDARERDLEPLFIRNNRAYLTMPGSIGTVRLLIQDG